jgi:TPR repeat protein
MSGGEKPVRLRRGETPAKVEAWRHAAGEGDVEAMIVLAEILGRRPETAAESERWWQAAMDAGSPTACHHFGLLTGRRDDLAEAERLFRRGAEAGDLQSMYGLYDVHEERGDHQAAQATLQMIYRQEQRELTAGGD